MGAIRILQERSTKLPIKVEYTQTNQIRTSSSTPDSSTSTPDSSTSTIIQEPPMLIKPGTKVYAVWSADDGLVYKVCLFNLSRTNVPKVVR